MRGLTRRCAWSVAAGFGAVALLGLTLAPSAGASGVADVAWWWQPQGTLPVALPPPSSVPEGGLLVQGGPAGATAIGAVRSVAVEAAGTPSLTLAVAEGSATNLVDGGLLACATATPWTSGGAQPWADRPVVDCAAAVAGDVTDDGTAVTFTLPPVTAGTVVDVVVLPATSDGQDFSGSNGGTVSVAFQPPTAVDVAPAPATAGGAPLPSTPVGTGDADGSSGGGPAPAGGGSRPAPVAAGRPAVAPSVTVPAAAAPGVAAPPTAARPAAPVAGSTSAFPTGGDPPTAAQLLPVLAVLALGPGGLLAARRWRPALVGAGGAPAAPAAVAAVAPVVGPLDVDPGEGVAQPVLSVRGVGVRFGGLHAVRDVDLDVYEGEIVGLIGPNGAGKTTLMECISGFQRVTAGTITYRGQDLLGHPASARASLGIGRTLQNVRLFPYLTVLDNLKVALHGKAAVGTLSHALALPGAKAEEAAVAAEATRIIELLGMQAFAEKFASELSYGTLRLLELGCMLALQPTFLLLDEPASGISQKETEALGPLLRQIQAATGATILMIEHDMPLVMSLSDRVYCLDAGSVLSAGTPAEVQADPAVAEAYLGTPAEQRKVAVAPNRPEDVEAELLLEVAGLDVFYDKVQVLYGVDFHVRRGERIALLGTNGAGKSTILKAASGLITPTAGTIRWKGQDVTGMAAEKLVRLGLGQVPGGRGLFPTLSVGENLRMGGYLYDDPAQVDAEVARVVAYFPWISQRSDQLAGTLSGGEQQQLATARALMSRPELLMIDELSLGLAPLVIERLMDTVQQLCEDEGLTVVVVEQQASFALGYTDRAYFMEKGEVRYEGPSSGLTGRGDLLRSVFLAGATAGFASEGAVGS